ncbi:cytochrome c oxidase assembly protein [Nonomuraea sp. NPDC005983]|uniref:cytochrome c oxidase assembly protein n=1 Tax=Nonomuraea sp. NPDC005983 TaxID=3155595 RepID=UPI0033A9F605
MRAPERIYAGAAVAVGVAVLVAALWFGGGAAEPEIVGLPTAGPLTSWGLPLVRFCYDLCAVACVGTLLAAVVLAPSTSPESAACVRAAGGWALGWAVTAVLSYVLTLSNIIPLPVANLLDSPDLLSFGTSIPQTQALLVVVAGAVVVTLFTRLRGVPRWIPLAIAAFALLPPAYVGHASSAADHDIAISALMAHLLGASVWVGGLGAVLVYFRRSHHLAVVLPRFSTIALCCFAAVTVSGLASAWVRLSSLSDLWQTRYGLLLLAKVTALVLLALLGWNHRRRTVAGVADRTVRRTFARLAAGELTVMAAAIGLAVGLSRSPPPAGGGGHDHLVLEYDLAPFTNPGVLITEVRLDPMILLLLALPAIGYLVGVRRVVSWPPGRTLAWYTGLALTALVLLGGVGGYARAMLSAHALQHTVLTVIAPLLLCLGAPLTLASQATTAASQYGDLGSRLLNRRVTHPALLLTIYTLPFLLLYGTAWLPWSLSGYATHLLTEFLFFGAGLLVFWVLAGIDPLPRPIAWAARAWLLSAVIAVHLALGAFLLFGPPVAADWFSLAAPPGVPDLLADQRLAGAILMLVPLLPLAVLAVRMAWLKQAALARLSAVTFPVRPADEPGSDGQTLRERS